MINEKLKMINERVAGATCIVEVSKRHIYFSLFINHY